MAEGENINLTEAETIEYENVREENEELLREISALCNRKDRKDVEKILLIGNIGAGKSSLVNTIIKALSGTYIPKAKVGQGSTQSKTFTLERYKSCGVAAEDIGEIGQRDLVEELLPRLPTIFDVAGKDNVDTEELQEILELLIGGHVPSGTSIEALQELQKEHDVGTLKATLFKTSRREWKMSKIVFVHSCRERIPKDLINCLQKVLKKTDPRTAQVKYAADVYVVMTKYDTVKDLNNFQWSTGEPKISFEEFIEIEKAIENQFSIQGALEDNRTRWVSYTDDSGKDNPFIDNIALKFIRRMVMPGNQRSESVKPVITTWTKMELKAKRTYLKTKQFITEYNFTFTLKHVVIMLAVLVFAVLVMRFIYTLLQSSPELGMSMSESKMKAERQMDVHDQMDDEDNYIE